MDKAIVMIKKIEKSISVIILVVFCVISATPVSSQENKSLIEVTPGVSDYAINVVKPILDASEKKDRISLLLKVSEILLDPDIGIRKNAIRPNTYMVYDKLDKIKLGFLATFNLTSEQKKIIKSRHAAFMRKEPADVFFAPSADEIITTRAAFGCSHYARAFMAVVKALSLIDNPGDMRYAISCKADDYNRARKQDNNRMIINGHQFVFVRINGDWVAINTSKSECAMMPKSFLPDSFSVGANVPVQFESYPGVTFLLRKIGKNYEDDCGDNSLVSLMNIYRSGNAQDYTFRWSAFADSRRLKTQAFFISNGEVSCNYVG